MTGEHWRNRMYTVMEWIRAWDEKTLFTSQPIPYLSFVIKGSEQFARERMFARGIVAHTTANMRTETVFACSIEYHNLVAQWFCESPELIPGYGYPDGTCLIYSMHDEVAQ